MLELVLVWNCK